MTFGSKPNGLGVKSGSKLASPFGSLLSADRFSIFLLQLESTFNFNGGRQNDFLL